MRRMEDLRKPASRPGETFGWGHGGAGMGEVRAAENEQLNHMGQSYASKLMPGMHDSEPPVESVTSPIDVLQGALQGAMAKRLAGMAGKGHAEELPALEMSPGKVGGPGEEMAAGTARHEAGPVTIPGKGRAPGRPSPQEGSIAAQAAEDPWEKLGIHARGLNDDEYGAAMAEHGRGFGPDVTGGGPMHGPEYPPSLGPVETRSGFPGGPGVVDLNRVRKIRGS